jgi:hypothetical protein
MNQIIDVDDEIFENNENIPPPSNKRRSSVLEFVDNLDAGARRLKGKKRDVLDHLNSTNNTDLLQGILRTMSGFENRMSVFINEQRQFNEQQRTFNEQQRTFNEQQIIFTNEQRAFNLRADNVFRKLDFNALVSENRTLRSLGKQTVDIPFLNPSVISPNTSLPVLRSGDQIERSTTADLKLYLQAYDIDFDNTWPRKKLKALLRLKLRFTGLNDLAVSLG